MKKLLPFIAITCTIALLSAFGGCTRTNPPPSLSTQIIGKWTMKNAIGNYTDYGVLTIDTTTFASTDYFNFMADGTLSIKQDTGSYNGNWQITGNRLYITNTHYIDFIGGFDMPVLTSTDLQLHDTSTGPNVSADQRLNLYR